MSIFNSVDDVMFRIKKDPIFMRSLRLNMKPLLGDPFGKNLMFVDGLLRSTYPGIPLLLRKKAADMVLRSVLRYGPSRSRRRKSRRSSKKRKSKKRRKSRRSRKHY